MQVRAPMPPSYMFVIDVSVAAVACGMLTAVVDGIKSALDDMVSSRFSSQGAGLCSRGGRAGFHAVPGARGGMSGAGSLGKWSLGSQWCSSVCQLGMRHTDSVSGS